MILDGLAGDRLNSLSPTFPLVDCPVQQLSTPRAPGRPVLQGTRFTCPDGTLHAVLSEMAYSALGEDMPYSGRPRPLLMTFGKPSKIPGRKRTHGMMTPRRDTSLYQGGLAPPASLKYSVPIPCEIAAPIVGGISRPKYTTSSRYHAHVSPRR